MITNMITGQIGHEVLLLINHNYNKIGDILGFFKIKTREILSFFLLAVKKSHFSAHVPWCILPN